MRLPAAAPTRIHRTRPSLRRMCAACVAQGIGYVGTALVGLQVMGVRAKARRHPGGDAPGAGDVVPAGSLPAGPAGPAGVEQPADA
jgi:hypothetical protein